MKFTTRFAPRHLVVAGLLAATGAVSFAQGTPPAAPPAPVAGTAAERGDPPPAGAQHMQRRGPDAQRHDPARMAEFRARHHAERQAEFKTRLQLTPQQEGAWTTFSGTMKPPAARPQRPDRAEFAKLTTPERLDRIQALKTQRDAEMAKRFDATRTFYAQLSPSQKKVFDLESAKGHGRHGHGGPRGDFKGPQGPGGDHQGHRGPPARG